MYWPAKKKKKKELILERGKSAIVGLHKNDGTVVSFMTVKVENDSINSFLTHFMSIYLVPVMFTTYYSKIHGEHKSA